NPAASDVRRPPPPGTAPPRSPARQALPPARAQLSAAPDRQNRSRAARSAGCSASFRYRSVPRPLQASKQMIKRLHLNPFARFHVLPLGFQYDKTVALAEGAENMRTLMPGGADG